jgi:hypothetical protein
MTTTLTAHLGELIVALHDVRRRLRQALRSPEPSVRPCASGQQP